MIKNSIIHIFIATILVMVSIVASAQDIHEPKAGNEEWTRSYQPFRIAGNLYYIGTYDLACYLITTSKGNIIINTGLASSASQIQHNIEALGFKFSDTKILLTTQVHYDHVGAMAAIQKSTGAQMITDEKDAAVLTDGGSSDYFFGGKDMVFAPVKSDRLLHDGDTVTLGEMQLVMLHHPGHTKGSCSYLFTVKDKQRSYKVLIANMPTIIVDGKFSDITAYPNMANDYACTLNAMKSLSFDIWLASHASQFNLHDKHKPGDAYNPTVFEDKKEYDEALADLQKAYEEKIRKE